MQKTGLLSRHLHGGSQTSIMPVPEDLTYSSDFKGHQTSMRHIYIHAGKPFVHIKNNCHTRRNDKKSKNNTLHKMVTIRNTRRDLGVTRKQNKINKKLIQT